MAGSPGTGGVVGGGVDGGTATGGVKGAAGAFGSDVGSGSSTPGVGSWHFDDCSPTSHFLSRFVGHSAPTRSKPCKAPASPASAGRGSRSAAPRTSSRFPTNPSSRCRPAWRSRHGSTRTRSLAISRSSSSGSNNQTSFSLGIHNGNIQMSVVLTTGKTFISSAPIPAGVWSHVAGMYRRHVRFPVHQRTAVRAGVRRRHAAQRVRAAALRRDHPGAVPGRHHRRSVRLHPEHNQGRVHRARVLHAAVVDVGEPAGQRPDPARNRRSLRHHGHNNDVGACPRSQYHAFFTSFDPTSPCASTATVRDGGTRADGDVRRRGQRHRRTPPLAPTRSRSASSLSAQRQLRAALRAAHVQPGGSVRLLRVEEARADDHQHQRGRRSGADRR